MVSTKTARFAISQSTGYTQVCARRTERRRLLHRHDLWSLHDGNDSLSVASPICHLAKIGGGSKRADQRPSRVPTTESRRLAHGPGSDHSVHHQSHSTCETDRCIWRVGERL